MFRTNLDKKKRILKKSMPEDFNTYVTYTDIIRDSKRQKLLSQIENAMDFDTETFQNLCIDLFKRVVDYCQLLPDSSTSYYALSGGFFDHLLNRAEAAVTLFREFGLVDNATPISDAQRLWIYALFSAAVLQGIAKLYTDYSITLFDKSGEEIADWNPLHESMISRGDGYRFDYLQAENDEFRCRLNVILALRLLPKAGYEWITSDPEILQVWLALIQEDMHSAGTLGVYLVRAEAIALQRYISDHWFKQGGLESGRGSFGRMRAFSDTKPGSLFDKELAVGAEFVHWLLDALSSGKIIFNEGPLVHVPGGVLMSVDTFKLFIREHPEYKTWQAIQSGFLALDLHDSKQTDNIAMQVGKGKEQASGVLVSKYAALLPDKLARANESKLQTALEVIAHSNDIKSGQQLSANGIWIAAQVAPERNAQPGRFYRG